MKSLENTNKSTCSLLHFLRILTLPIYIYVCMYMCACISDPNN